MLADQLLLIFTQVFTIHHGFGQTCLSGKQEAMNKLT
jgi:hypothetical protein